MLFRSILCLLLWSTAGHAWELIELKDEEGIYHSIEQAGEGGAFLYVTCYDKREQIDIEFPAGNMGTEDASILLQVDQNGEALLAGFIDNVDRSTSIFIGLDRSGKPSVATQKLIRQMRAGNELYFGDPDYREAIDVWPLKGFTKAHNALKKKCGIS